MSEVTEERTVTRDEVVGRECDWCHLQSRDARELEGWLHFLERHGGWGNDDIESHFWYDVCSPGCFVNLARRLAEDIKRYPDAEVADMPVPFLLGLLDLVSRHVEPGDKG